MSARPYENMVRNKRIEYDGHVWTIDAKAFYSGAGGTLRIYKVHGDVTTPTLKEALDLEAASIGLAISMHL